MNPVEVKLGKAHTNTDDIMIFGLMACGLPSVISEQKKFEILHKKAGDRTSSHEILKRAVRRVSYRYEYRATAPLLFMGMMCCQASPQVSST